VIDCVIEIAQFRLVFCLYLIFLGSLIRKNSDGLKCTDSKNQFFRSLTTSATSKAPKSNVVFGRQD